MAFVVNYKDSCAKDLLQYIYTWENMGVSTNEVKLPAMLCADAYGGRKVCRKPQLLLEERADDLLWVEAAEVGVRLAAPNKDYRSPGYIHHGHGSSHLQPQGNTQEARNRKRASGTVHVPLVSMRRNVVLDLADGLLCQPQLAVPLYCYREHGPRPPRAHPCYAACFPQSHPFHVSA